MQKHLIQILTPPLFDGIDLAQSARLLRFILQLTIAISVIGLGINLFIEVSFVRLSPIIVGIVVPWGLKILLGHGHIRWAGFLYLAFLGIIVGSISAYSGGINSPVFGIFAVLVFLSGILFGGWGGYVLSALVILFGGILVLLKSADVLPQWLEYRPIDTLLVQIMVYAALLGLLFTMMKNLQKALEIAQREVNERRQAETAFRQLERRYKAIFDHTNDAVILMDFDSTILDINQRCIEMFGYEKQEMLGRKGLDLIAPGEREAGQEKLSEVAERHVLPIYERKMARGDQTEFFVEVNLSLVFDDNGVPIQTQSVLRDITERKKTETKLRDIEHRYRTLFEGSNDGIFILGMDGLIEEVNPQAANMLGFMQGEIIGVNASSFVAPDQKPDVSYQISTLLQQGSLPIYERVVRRRDGTEITFEINAGVVYDVDGNPQNIQSIVRDISGRKQAEENLYLLIRQLERQRNKIQTSLEVSKAAISILDSQILIQQTVNLIKDRFEYYYVGLFLVDPSRRFVVLRAGTGEAGKRMLTNGHKLPIGEGSMVGWSVTNRQPRIAHDVGLDAVHFDNPLLPDTRSEMAVPLIARGDVIGALTVQSAVEAAFSEEDIAVLQVMTDLVAVAIENADLHSRITIYAEELEQRVRERTAQLQTTNRELESFSYSISHDLRAPLRAINGYSSILLEDFSGELSPQARGFQEKIRSNAIRMGELVDGLLAFSRLGRKKVQKAIVNPRELVGEVLEELEPEITTRHIEIIIGELPPCDADPLLLKQVYANLISNALKFTREQKKAQVIIGSQLTERGLTYFVKDNGAGFDMQYANRLFGVFQRLHRDEEFEGTGVGLAIIQRIILRHGGEVWAQGQLEKGASFFFTLGSITIEDSGIFF